jgi:hypothetical protein
MATSLYELRKIRTEVNKNIAWTEDRLNNYGMSGVKRDALSRSLEAWVSKRDKLTKRINRIIKWRRFLTRIGLRNEVFPKGTNK